MKLKLLLGIFLPLVLIIVLVILSTARMGFSVATEMVKSIQFNDLFVVHNSPANARLLQTITITNDFFLPRKYELPELIVCLSDTEGIKGPTSLQVKYAEGSYSRGSNAPFFDEIFLDYNSYYRQSIELPAKSKKQVKVLVEPQYLYAEIQSFKEYDELLLIHSKSNKNYYGSCSDLAGEELSTAIHIPIVGK